MLLLPLKLKSLILAKDFIFLENQGIYKSNFDQFLFFLAFFSSVMGTFEAIMSRRKDFPKVDKIVGRRKLFFVQPIITEL